MACRHGLLSANAARTHSQAALEMVCRSCFGGIRVSLDDGPADLFATLEIHHDLAPAGAAFVPGAATAVWRTPFRAPREESAPVHLVGWLPVSGQNLVEPTVNTVTAQPNQMPQGVPEFFPVRQGAGDESPGRSLRAVFLPPVMSPDEGWNPDRRRAGRRRRSSGGRPPTESGARPAGCGRIRPSGRPAGTSARARPARLPT